MNTELGKETEPGVIDSVNRQDVSPADPNWRWKGPDVRQGDRVAQAQARIRQLNIDRASGGTHETAAMDMPRERIDQTWRIVHDLGLTNTNASLTFIHRMLVLEETVNTQDEIILALCTEVEALKKLTFGEQTRAEYLDGEVKTLTAEVEALQSKRK